MFSRSKLALSAFALLASGGVMAAAGPDQNKRNDGDDSKFSLRVNIGGGDNDWFSRRGHSRPVYCEPAPVFAELAPHSLELQAFQAGDTVIILARGENTTAGFTTSLEREGDRRNDGTARVTLHNYGPIHNHRILRAEGGACIPFNVSGGFETRENLREVTVCIAGQERCIPVQRIDQMRGR